MNNIGKPTTGDWPDTLKLDVASVPIVIDYADDAVIAPYELKGSQLGWGIAKYLIVEGFIEPPEEIKKTITELGEQE